MAVAISRTADPAGVSATSNVATYSAQSIGVAAEDRIVFLVVGTELASASPNSATIDYGTGAVAMSAGTQGNFGAVYARIFYAKAPTGTTADFTVTFGANASSTQNHVSVYRVVGASFTLTSGGNGSTDMDATAPLTTGAITIPTNGGFIAVAAGATDTVAKTWANATEDLDADVGGFRHTTATRTTALTATAVTCTGGTTGEDGAMSWVILSPGTFVNPGSGSYSLTGTAATPKLGRKIVADSGSYTLTGTAATPKKGQTIVAGGGSYTLTGTDAAPKHAWVTAAGTGSYTLTGTDATPKHGWLVTAAGGAYSLTGTDATLTATNTTQPEQRPSGGWGWLNNLNPPSRIAIDEQDSEPEKKSKRKAKKKAERIVLAPDIEIKTGIVEIIPAADEFDNLRRFGKEADLERRKRLRAIALADDEWMMMA